ncbi:uncharacterized protein LOC113218113 [Frankliniella occidentalis]|uniref:Uncharacterized protein LOC113218113 n=1 Tax=Frankliniella occidentalis TaxID=133901 RepID=A0A9C6X7W0_FRAOC|nr:uncharacterized protein LOC113218113 [Frankliniella occidentalis]
MKAKATDEDGGVETVVGVRPALKSFLHQVISDQQECNKGGLGPGLGPLGLNGKRTVSALSRLIELPNLDAKKEPPSPPAKPKNNVNNNNKNVRGHERLERKAAVLLPDKPAVQAVEPAPSSKPASATAVATAAAATPNGAGQRTKTVTDDWWRERASRPGATAVASSLRREALSRKSSDADGRRGASPARKPSFKVAAHRTKSRTHTPAVTAAVKVTIPSTRSSRVQALATKFNSMEETTPPTSPTSPSPAPDIKIIVGNRAGVLKSVSPAIMDEVKALSDKIHHLQDLQDKQSKVALVRKRPSFAKSRVAANGNKVKAAVKIFEHGPGETATQTTKSRPTTQDGATQTPPAVDPPATNGLTLGAGAAEETAISDVPKKEETSRRKPQRPVSPVSPGARRVREETLADKALADKARRSYNHKVMLKTSKSVLSENSSKRLVVVNFDDDDIDAIPPLPSTPPPDQRPATTSSSTPVRDILARAVSPVPLPVAPEVTAPKLPPPGEIADEKEPPVAPALPERNTLAEEDDEEAMNAKIQANRSFLWRPAPPVPQQSKRKDTDDGPSFRAVPALIEPDVEVSLAGRDDNPEVDDDPQELYDDVVSPTDENIYDDIGVDVKKRDEQPQQEMYETCGGGNYDDCEGEGYQFVDSAGQQGPASAAVQAQASPQRVATTLEEEDETEDNIYDDVLSERRPPSPPAPAEADDAVSTSGVYEAIYLVRPKGQRGPPPSRRLPLLPPGVPGRGLGVGRHGSSCSSSSSSRSSSAGNASSYCGKINSIYGESLTDEQAMAVAAVLELPFEPGAVQAARVPLSETSDEWVDLDNTPTDQEDQDDEETIVVFRDQPRRRRATSWSRKVRTQRTRSPRRRGKEQSR